MIVKRLFLSLLIFTLISCSEEPPQEAPVHPNEKISEVQMRFISKTPADTIIYRYSDPGGTGGVDSVVVSHPLKSNTDYEVLLDFYSYQDSLPVSLNEELTIESRQHQVFFVKQDTLLDIDFEYADSDGNGNPMGLKTTAYTHDPSTGPLKVVLLHQPKKGDPSVQAGDILKASGTTDFEAQFDVVIQ